MNDQTGPALIGRVEDIRFVVDKYRLFLFSSSSERLHHYVTCKYVTK